MNDIHPLRLFARSNRGILLDLLMFIANLFLMQMLSGHFIAIYRRTSDSDAASRAALGLCCVAMLALPAIGAVLKRWHYHQRLGEAVTTGSGRGVLWGCLCNPIFYFCLNLVLISAIMTVGGELLFGDEFQKNGSIFVPSILLGMLIVGVQTFLVYRYFIPPKAPPRWEFLRDDRSEVVGDICIYLNVALFQAGWNLMMFFPFDPLDGALDFAGRLFFLSFIALLIYFPPRIFYLAEDINRPGAWLTMLLANTPVIARVLFGVGSPGELSW